MRPNALAAVVAAAVAAVPTLALPRAPEVPDRWGPYSVYIVDEGGAPLPTFQHRGRTFVLGSLGTRYLVRVHNGSGARAEVVVSVDGRDVVDGRPSALDKRGYVVAPYSEVTIDGYRLDERSVAAFRFSSVSRSYASRMGDARDVGVIGVAVFPERPRPVLAPPPWYRGRAPYGGAQPAPEPGRESRSEAPSGAKSAAPALRDSAPAWAELDDRPGLGTEFGEEHGSPVERVDFERASSRPACVLTVRYDDREGLLAAGIDVDGRRLAHDDAWRSNAEPFRRDPAFAQPPPGWAGR